MTPDALRALVRWLARLAGYNSREPIETENDLREWARHVARYHEPWMTSVDYEAVTQLIEELAPPEERARAARQARERKRRAERQGKCSETDPDGILAYWTSSRDKLKAFQKSGAAAKKEAATTTRNQIIEKYKASTLPERERATHVAKSVNKSAHHVRRVLKQEGVK